MLFFEPLAATIGFMLLLSSNPIEIICCLFENVQEWLSDPHEAIKQFKLFDRYSKPIMFYITKLRSLSSNDKN